MSTLNSFAPRALAALSLVLCAPALVGQQETSPLPGGRFDPAGNPAIGVTLDGFMLLADDQRPTPASNYNNLFLRTVELDLSGRIDPFGWGYLITEFGRDGEEDHYELIEAAVWADQLPHNFSLRGGRFLADFGKWGPLHQHERATSLMEGVRREFLGGSLRMDGLELHQWFGVGDVPVRWSLGLGGAFEGHGHSILPGAAGDGLADAGGLVSGGEGRRGLGRTLWTGRITAQHDFSADGYFQWGLSGLHTASGRHQQLTESGVTQGYALGQTTLALDLSWRVARGQDQSADLVGMEMFWNDRDVVESFTEGVFAAQGAGVWGFWEHQFDPHWALAVHGSWWQAADQRGGIDWFPSGDAGAMFTTYATWSLSERQRLRLGLTHYDPLPGNPADLVLSLQWIATFGSHTHGLDW